MNINNLVYFNVGLPWNASEDSKIRSDIELSKMRLLRRQQQLRNDVAHELRCVVALETTQEDSCFRRKSVRTYSEHKIQQNRDQEIKRRKKHAEYLDAVTSHCKAFKEYHTSMAQKMRRINRSLLNYHTSRARKEQQQKEREEKERMKALKVCYINFIMKLIIKLT